MVFYPNPDDEQVDVIRDTVLNWTPGIHAATHNVYLGTSFDNVNDADIANPLGVLVSPGQSASTYDPGRLDFGQTYYWRIDEVNAPPDPASHRIFESWIDGFGVATNGALVGYDPPQSSYAETVIVHGGAQSMPIFYSNTGGAASSEATRTFAAQDWTSHGVTTLGLYFFGTAGNTGAIDMTSSDLEMPYEDPGKVDPQIVGLRRHSSRRDHHRGVGGVRGR